MVVIFLYSKNHDTYVINLFILNSIYFNMNFYWVLYIIRYYLIWIFAHYYCANAIVNKEESIEK